MDFMKWISSLDELLYEVMSWLLFFPFTLWRSLVHPLRMMDYADEQLLLPEGEQYDAALSPPLFLALSLLLAHALSVALGQSDRIVADHHGLAGLINDETSALVLRLVLFACFALFAATRLVRREGGTIGRKSLRQPFYAQCYPTAVFALGLTLGISLTQTGPVVVRWGGGVLIGASLIHYGVVETRWFARKLGIGYGSAMGGVMLSLVEGLGLILFMGFLFSR